LAYRGASPLGLPYTRSRSPLRRLAPIAWLVRFAHSLLAVVASWTLLLEDVEQPLGDAVECKAHRRAALRRERHAEIAVTRELRIEGHGPETRDVERRRSLGLEQRLDGVAVAAVVAAHVLDVAEGAIVPPRQRGDRAGDHASSHLGRDRHEEERGSCAEKVGVLNGPLGSRRQIEHQQIERAPLERSENLREERELPPGAPRVRLALRRALELERFRLRDQRAHRKDSDPVRRSRERDLVAPACRAGAIR